MSVTLNINGVDYFYPETGDLAWGPDATDWAQAVTSGMLQKAGGLFLLLAETEFGPNYGLKSLYYKSNTANPASQGSLRLARIDGIYWRNEANTGDLGLTVNSSNELLFNGAAITAAVAWGDITGTLSAQTDLQTALDAKVAGPASAQNNGIVRFDGITGKLVQDSVGLIDDSGNLSDLKTISLRNDDALTGGAQNMIQLENRNDAATSHPHIEFRRSRASNANLANGDEIGGINAHPRHNSATLSAAEILAVYTGDGTTRTADWTFLTSNSSAPAERVRITGAGSLQIAGLTANRALATDASKGLVSSATTDTELGYVSGVTSAIQTQLNNKQATGNYITALTGEVTASGPGSASATVANSAVIGKVLTGYVSGAGTVAATDTILQAINKLNGNDGLNLKIANNLSDLNNVVTARSNLGLGSLATQSGTFSGTSSGTNTGDQTITLTGDVTGSGTGSFAATIASAAVSLAKMANLAANSIIGNNTGGAATPIALSATQVTAMLNDFVGDSGSGGTKGLVKAPGSGDAAANKFLKADGTWATTPSGFANPMTTEGDLILATTAGAPTRLPIGSNTYVLTSNGTTASWQAASGGGANTSLSNLASVAINTSLIFANGVIGQIYTNDRTGATSSELILISSGQTANAASGFVGIYSGTTTGSGASGEVVLSSGDSPSGGTGASSVITGNATSSGATGSIAITSGNATSGNSGSITLTTGTASATRGKIKFVDGSEGTTGHVWTSTDTLGNGHWAAPSGGGDMVLASVQTVTGAKTFGTIGGAVDKFILAGSTSGSTIVNAAAVAGSTTMTLPSTTGTLIGTGDTGTVTNTMLAGSIAYSKLSLTTSIVNGDIANSTINLTTKVTGLLPIANGGTNSSATATNGGVGYGTGTAHAYTAAGTSGQILSSNGAGAPTWISPAAGVVASYYRTILETTGSHIAARVAGTYALNRGSNAAAVGGTGTLYVQSIIRIDAADYPSVNGVAATMRLKTTLAVNNVAPTGNFTFGLYPITRPASSGGAGVNILTIGTVVSGSNGATYTTPAADAMSTATSADFAIPADGYYVVAVLTTATVATSSLVWLTASLQVKTASGTAGVAYANLAGNITAVSGTTYLVDCSAARTITLPAASANASFTVKDKTGQAFTNNITIARAAAESIEGVAANKTLQTNWGSWTFVCDGTNWFII